MRGYTYGVSVMAVAYALLLTSPTGLFSQNDPAAPLYNRAAEVTIKGTVTGISTILSRGYWGGTHLMLKTEKEILSVHIGSSKFLMQNKMTIVPGDQIEVTGSKAKFFDSYALMAREITNGDHKLTLRDAKGVPIWPGARRW